MATLFHYSLMVVPLKTAIINRYYFLLSAFYFSLVWYKPVLFLHASQNRFICSFFIVSAIWSHIPLSSHGFFSLSWICSRMTERPKFIKISGLIPNKSPSFALQPSLNVKNIFDFLYWWAIRVQWYYHKRISLAGKIKFHLINLFSKENAAKYLSCLYGQILSASKICFLPVFPFSCHENFLFWNLADFFGAI